MPLQLSKFRSSLFCFLTLSQLAIPTCVLSQELAPGSAVASRLQELREQVTREEDRLDMLKVQQGDLKKSVSAIELELKSIRDKRGGLAESIQALEAESESLQKALKTLAEQIRLTKERLRTRTAAIYKMYRRSAAIDYLFSANSVTDMLKRSKALTLLATHDRKQIESRYFAIQDYQSKTEALDNAKMEVAAQIVEFSQLERELEKKRAEQGRLLRELDLKGKDQEQSIVKLRRSLERMERALSDLMGGETVQVTGVPVSPEPPPPQTDDIAPVPFDGPGLGRVKGTLPLPVEGVVVRAFGRQQHEEFSDMLFVKGMEFKVAASGKVRAIADGRVVYSNVLPGYGNVIIVDHGARYYSLYARLKDAMPRLGSDVRQGEVIANLGELDARGRNFYFELRFQGKAIDPGGYFATKPQVAS